MRVRAKKLTLGLALAALTVAGLAAASEVIILNPAEMTGQVAFAGGDPVASFVVKADSTDGLTTSETFTSSPYSLTVEGGHDYRPQLTAYFSNPTASESYLTISRSTAVAVGIGAPPYTEPTTVDFNYLSSPLAPVTYTISVAGGTIAHYYVYASASAGGESYNARNFQWFGAPRPPSSQGHLLMFGDDQVNVQGSAVFITADGTQIGRSLETKTINLSGGQNHVGWEVDLATKGQLSGIIDVDSPFAASSRHVNFYGVGGTPASGLNGQKYVAPNAGLYTLDLPPGQYDVFLRTYFSSPDHFSDTKAYRVAVGAGSTTPQDFVETLGTGRVPLLVGPQNGFFSDADLSSAQMQLTHSNPGSTFTTYAYAYTLQHPATGSQFDFALAGGSWRRQALFFNMYDASAPELPLDVDFSRYHYADPDVPAVTVAPGQATDLGAEVLTLVKANAYLEVSEPEGDAQKLLSAPYVELYKYDYSADNSLKTWRYIVARGSLEPRAQQAFTMVAEPGTYQMQAFATVDGSVTEFVNKTITFPTPVSVDDSTGGDVSVTPVENEDVTVTLTFSGVAGGGVATVVEMPLGPAPPEGLKMYCGAGSETCDPKYYDLQTTTQASSVRVCVRRKHVGGFNGMLDLLGLYQYDPANTPSSEPTHSWKKLEGSTVTDCNEDPVACGCETAASCGVDVDADPAVFVFEVCGEVTPAAASRAALAGASAASGSSLFALFEAKRRDEFTNVVGGVTYEGPNGPPALQTWAVPATSVYRITATGAQGASAAAGLVGGCGAEISGEFALTKNETLQILVGQKGTAAGSNAGGGGGTFVVRNGAPLVVAGGGGGVRSGATVNGRPGSLTTAGGSGSTSTNYTTGFIPGGVDGNGGTRKSSYGSGGGGWLTSGASDGTYGQGGFSFLLGGKGGVGTSCGVSAPGGYGGGAAGNGCYGGGGGGGYSGGGGGRVAGGGGSWNAGANPTAAVGACGHGKVTIEFVRVQ
ncbi:MAG TPA: hypothetical protein VFS43_46515 [Polyangiaceae bacterium]|nr:hypothetical protein [Polyangiaceae bacterium]